MAYSDVFGSSTIYPSPVGLLAVALTADITLEWPFEGTSVEYPAAPIIDVTCTVAASITLPDATIASPGQSILFNGLSASTQSFTVEDAGGATIATVAPGEQWQIYLASNATTAGTWRVVQFGASTATVQASALAGAGLTVLSNQLAQNMPGTTFNSTRTVLVAERGTAFVWTGSGAGTLNLPAAATATGGFFFAVRNSGGGALTIDPSGGETIDDVATLALAPGESTMVLTEGAEWFTVGLGKDAVFAFDFTTISLASAAATYTLAGAELNRIAYRFTGLLTNNVEVVVPNTVQQYWVDNATTGAYTVKLKTSGGTAVEVTQGVRSILYCDATEVRAADTGGISTPISAADGGTGQTSYAVGDLLYASNATIISKLADVATGNALISGGVGVAPSYGKIGLTTHVSGTLPVGSGGTGITGTPTNGQLAIGNGTNFTLATLTAGPGVNITNASGSIAIRLGGAVTAVAASTVDCSTADYFTKTASGNITWVFSNAPTGGFGFVLRLTNGGAYTMTWPASVDWPSGTAPTLTAAGVDMLAFITDDAGTTWRGVRMQRDSR